MEHKYCVLRGEEFKLDFLLYERKDKETDAWLFCV